MIKETRNQVRAEVDKIVSELNKLMPELNLSLSHAYGGVQLEYKNCTSTLTGYLSYKEMRNYLYAFRKGFYASKGML